MTQVGWVLTHLDDVASDFSAIHRVPDIRRLSGPVFFRFAFRLTAYESVMRARHVDAAAERAAAGTPPDEAFRYGADTPSPRRGVTDVPATKVALQADPLMSKIISFG